AAVEAGFRQRVSCARQAIAVFSFGESRKGRCGHGALLWLRVVISLAHSGSYGDEWRISITPQCVRSRAGGGHFPRDAVSSARCRNCRERATSPPYPDAVWLCDRGVMLALYLPEMDPDARARGAGSARDDRGHQGCAS